jgi:flagellar hook-associated protein 1 FlgK
MSSTFSGLYIGKSGVQAARAALNITGQNITNANTDGYTRQRVDQSALSPAALDMLYAAAAGSHTGQGTGITGIEQLRDKFLDSEYRTQNAVSGSTSTQVSALKDIETALDESTTDGVSAAFSKLIKQMEGLTSSGSSTTYTESTLKEAAALFATKLNTAASNIDTTWSQQYSYLTNYGTDKVNTLLKSIAGLSDTIKSAQISGQPALELLDQRNSAIDELSQYVSVKVEESPTSVGAGRTVDTLSLVLADASGNALDGGAYKLVDGNQYASFSVSPSSNAAPYTPVKIGLSGLTKDGSNIEVSSKPITTGTSTNSTYTFQVGSDTSTINVVSTAADMKTLQADFQAAIASSSIAGKVTVGVSSDGTQLTFIPTDGSSLSISSAASPSTPANNILGIASATSEDSGVQNSDLQTGELNGYLKLLNENGEFDTVTDFRGIGYYRKMLDTVAQNFATVMNKLNSTNDAGDNKPLFTNNLGATDVINAGNIRIASNWTAGYLTTSKDASNPGDNSSGSNTNVTAMLTALNSTKYTLMTGSKKLFTGTVQESVSDISLTLGQDIDSIQSQDNTNSNMLGNIETRRQALSSVDINEEAINLTVYNQALSAAARFTTTVDECLSTIINNMGVAGR